MVGNAKRGNVAIRSTKPRRLLVVDERPRKINDRSDEPASYDTGGTNNPPANLTRRYRMPTTRFDSTLKALKEGAKSFTIEKATTNIEGWETYLEKHDHEGVKKVVTDLGKLKKLLHAKELDGEAIKKLLGTLGKDTVAVAGKEESAVAAKIKELGEALSTAA